MISTLASCAAEDKGEVNDLYSPSLNGNGAPSKPGNMNMAADAELEESFDRLPPSEAPDGNNGDLSDSEPSTGSYGALVENPFLLAEKQPVSTFSADVDTASYAYFRKLVNAGYSVEELIGTAGSSIRTEEMVNYFDYSTNKPAGHDLFGVKFTAISCPWNEKTVLLTATLSTEPTVEKTKNNLVFLIDVSGSMASSDKLELIKKSFSHLVSAIGDDDIISIVTYSGNSDVVLDGCSGAKKDKIMKAINGLKTGGGTNGESGMRKAYEIAESHFLPDGNNRIIMASDGDLNVGISSVSEIENFVAEKRKSGVYLSVLGFGTGNYKDDKMETIADKGNGVYYYVDGEYEAERIFGEKLLSTLYPVASDVKLQITFDPSSVKSYRLIGYENRLLNEEDFKDDTKDAGELGAGHSVTVCYELVLNEAGNASEAAWGKLAVRHKPIGEEKSVESSYDLTQGAYTETPDDDIKFISALVETSMILHKSKYSDIKLDRVISDLSALNLTGDRAQFLDLLKKLNAD